MPDYPVFNPVSLPFSIVAVHGNLFRNSSPALWKAMQASLLIRPVLKNCSMASMSASRMQQAISARRVSMTSFESCRNEPMFGESDALLSVSVARCLSMLSRRRRLPMWHVRYRHGMERLKSQFLWNSLSIPDYTTGIFVSIVFDTFWITFCYVLYPTLGIDMGYLYLFAHAFC